MAKIRTNLPQGAANVLTPRGAKNRFWAYAGKQPFDVPAGIGTTATDSFTINNDANFFCQFISFSATSPLLLLQIKLSDTNAMRRSVKIDLLAGNGQEANIIPYLTPLYFGRSQTVSLEWTNQTAALNQVYIVFRGYEKLRHPKRS